MYLSLSEEPEIIYSHALALSNLIPNCFSYMHNVDSVKNKTFESLKTIWSINPNDDKSLLADLMQASQQLLTVAKELTVFFDEDKKYSSEMSKSLTKAIKTLELILKSVDNVFILTWNAYYVVYSKLVYEPRLASLSKSFLSLRDKESLKKLIDYYSLIYIRVENSTDGFTVVNYLKDKVLDLEVSQV